MFRFLHLADLHLDTTFLCRSEPLRAQLRRSLREALRSAVDYACHQRLDAVLMAGDVFDSSRLTLATETFFLDQVRRLEEARIPCIAVSGNHDPAGAGRHGLCEWPSNYVRVETPDPVVIPVESRNGANVAEVVAAGHPNRHEERNLASAFPVARGRVPTVGLLHAMVTAASAVEDHDSYAPCTVRDLEKGGYSYWALGHIHVRQRIDASVEAWYAGNLQGRNPRESGTKGGLLVEISDSGVVNVTFQPFGSIRWETLVLSDLDDVRHPDQLRSRLEGAFKELVHSSGEDQQGWLIRISLEGSCPLAALLCSAEENESLAADLQASLGVLDVEIVTRSLTPPVDPERFAGSPHVLSEVLHLLQRAGRDPAVLSELDWQPAAVNRGSDPAYLQTLLQGLDREIVSRFLKEADAS